MCGFGDKDRRPITPPPCIRLVITDLATGREINDPNEIDSTYFVLMVDLFDQNGGGEVNLVRHNQHTPSVSISTTSTTGYPPPPDRHLVRIDTYQPGYGPSSMGGVTPVTPNPYMTNQGYPVTPVGQSDPTSPHTPTQPGSFQAPGHNPYAAPPPGAMQPMMGYPSGAPVPQPPPGYMVQVNSVAHHAPSNGMFTRNLIGSLSVNAFKLLDTEDKIGFWFILQDLSVRTEGFFRYSILFPITRCLR